MSENPSPKGRLRAYLNPHKLAGDNRPAFQGHVTLPGDATERPLSLWAHMSQKGHPILTGKAGETAMEQIAQLAKVPEPPESPLAGAKTNGKQFAIDTHDVMLFPNTGKDAEHAKRPDYWGYFNPGAGHALMRLSVWAETDTHGKAMLRGNLVAHDPELEREGDQPAPVKRRRRERSR